MRKLLLLLATVAATAGLGFAQAPAAQKMPTRAGLPETPAQTAKRATQYLTKELGLSATQQARLEPIMRDQNQALLAMRSKAQTGRLRPGMGPDLKATLAKYDTQIKGVLTPGQYTKYTRMQDAERNKVMKHLAEQGMAMPTAR
ncbi:hypothetical protein GCM10028824_11090 [Hymenobacter segetis]|uniref:DUF4168 domain-containing protein n=1 Tax=Hymenobacter segetis TaxID=2025509 RepID=A0ABU9LYJ6_9BACT